LVVPQSDLLTSPKTTRSPHITNNNQISSHHQQQSDLLTSPKAIRSPHITNNKQISSHHRKQSDLLTSPKTTRSPHITDNNQISSHHRNQSDLLTSPKTARSPHISKSDCFGLRDIFYLTGKNASRVGNKGCVGWRGNKGKVVLEGLKITGPESFASLGMRDLLSKKEELTLCNLPRVAGKASSNKLSE
jgi:hypothetical protein